MNCLGTYQVQKMFRMFNELTVLLSHSNSTSFNKNTNVHLDSIKYFTHIKSAMYCLNRYFEIDKHINQIYENELFIIIYFNVQGHL